MGQTHPDTVRPAQRVPAPGSGYPGRHGRCGHPEAALRDLLPGVVARTQEEGGVRPDHRGRGLLSGWGEHPPDGQVGRDPGHQRPVEVPGLADGHRARRTGRVLPPSPARGGRAVHVRGGRRAEHEGPRGRPGRQRGGPAGHRRQRRRPPRGVGPASRHVGDRGGVERVLRRPGGPRSGRGPPGHF